MTWRILFDIAEQTHAQIAGGALLRACGSAALELVRLGALIRTAEAALLTPLTSWDSDDDAFEYGYEAGGLELTGARVRVMQPAHDPYVYRLNLDWMLRSVATALGIRRSAPLTESIPDTLWRLGIAAAGDRDCIFFLARRLHQGDAVVKVLAELSGLLHREPLIVLTTARPYPGLPVPPGIRCVSLHECAWLDGGSIALDHALITEVARSAFSTAVLAGEFWHSPTYDVVRLRGVEFRLGPIRREVVRKLHEASRTDQPLVSGKLLLPDPTTRMVDTFKSLKPSWRLLIESDRRGNYRLNL
jgi:hypothetical protein